MSFLKPRHVVEFLTFGGPPVVDRFGNETPRPGAWESVPVIGWAVVQSTETGGDSVLRTVDVLNVYVPAKFAPEAASKVRLPNGDEWAVDGNVLDYTHGPFWDPGAVVVQARKVDG